MYVPLSPYTHQRYSSLNNSFIEPAPTHIRTQSNSKIIVPALQTLEKSKVPSQKKLTLTCQTTLPSARATAQEGESHLKKRGGDYKEMKAKFSSLQISQVRGSEPSTYRQNAEENQLGQFKKVLMQRLKQLQTAYANTFKQYENQLKTLQMKLNDNSRELQAKTKKIELLESSCNKYRATLEKMCGGFSGSALGNRINDLEAKLRVLVYHNQQIQQEQRQSLDWLKNKLICELGRRISTIRYQNQHFVKQGIASINKLQQIVDGLKQRSEKLSQGTRGSMQNVGLEPKQLPSFHSQDQGGVSFWDDCFFYPSESAKSDSFEHILEMAKRRQQALACWVDAQEFLRYCDSDSYIFNRKGDRIRLPKEQLRELVALKLIVLR